MQDELTRHRGRAASAAAAGTVLATFDGPARAIRCALAMLDESRRLGIQVRAGLHTGECDVLDGELGGHALRVATWVMAQAAAGEVLASSTVSALVAGSSIAFEEHDVRVASGPGGAWRLFRVTPEPGPAPIVAEGGRLMVHRPARLPDQLTPREREVAALLARGLTNRQIADQLVISTATAERHVLNILNKLGYRSRAQVAAWAVESGLLGTA
jgi:DNA-binding CsgD family transcriptional regulator